MEIRNIQKTGNMHYLYLPTKWCKANKINSDSKVSVDLDERGNLIVSPKIVERLKKKLMLKVSEDNQELINMLLVACYINPTDSFKINLDKELDFTKILDQKKLISLEVVELDGSTISCDSPITIADTESLLKTLVSKIRNMLFVMSNNYNRELIERYEEEVDRTKLHLEKSVIEAFTFGRSSRTKAIDLYYYSLIARQLEQAVDYLVSLDEKEQKFFKIMLDIINTLKDILDNQDHFDYNTVLKFTKKVMDIEKIRVKDVATYDKRRAKRCMLNVAEVLLDKSITKELE
ncbi:hypothetical protein ACFL0W_01295 [Nanoarchaeota archaeon]